MKCQRYREVRSQYDAFCVIYEKRNLQILDFPNMTPLALSVKNATRLCVICEKRSLFALFTNIATGLRFSRITQKLALYVKNATKEITRNIYTISTQIKLS